MWYRGWTFLNLVCLDAFNIAGRVWGDPVSSTGKTSNVDADLAVWLRRLVDDVDLSKLFYIQVVDMERMDMPPVKSHPYHVEGNPARTNWSRNARACMYETDKGAYLPSEDVAKLIIHRLGYKVWVSIELLSRN
jgi:4-hydroxyphenylpyruvate dioxygenase